MIQQDYKTTLQNEYLDIEEINLLRDIKTNQDNYFKIPIEDL